MMAHSSKFPSLSKAPSLAKFRKPCLDITAGEIREQTSLPAPASESALTLAAIQIQLFQPCLAFNLLFSFLSSAGSFFISHRLAFFSPTPHLDSLAAFLSAYKAQILLLALETQPGLSCAPLINRARQRHRKNTLLSGDSLSSLLSLAYGSDFCTTNFSLMPLHCFLLLPSEGY